jgi:SagB-type dehydrogenase family enzyme
MKSDSQIRAVGRGPATQAEGRIGLPEPRRTSGTMLEAAMSGRRSERDFARGPIALAELAQLLWAAQGFTHDDGRRTAPSAGATYPLEVYAVAGDVQDLPPGVYRYQPGVHALVGVGVGDRRRALAAAALEQYWIAGAPLILATVALFGRTTGRYGRRGERYVHMEAGHVGQNICLQAVALGLGTTVVGAFDDQAVKAVIGTDQPGDPLCLLPVGRV